MLIYKMGWEAMNNYAEGKKSIYHKFYKKITVKNVLEVAQK